MGFLAMNRSSAFSHRREIQSDKSGELNAENWLERNRARGCQPEIGCRRIRQAVHQSISPARRGVAWRVAIKRPGRAGNSTRSRCLRSRRGREQPFPSLLPPPIAPSRFLFGKHPAPETKPDRISVIRVNQILSRVVSIVSPCNKSVVR